MILEKRLTRHKLRVKNNRVEDEEKTFSTLFCYMVFIMCIFVYSRGQE